MRDNKISIGAILTGAWTMYVSFIPWSLIATGALILAIIIGWASCQSTSKNEQAADDARTDTILQDSSTNVYANRVEDAAESVNEREKETDKVKRERDKANQTDSSVNADRDAQKRFCERFPNDSTCK
jgi:maltose-binding protein MalE